MVCDLICSAIQLIPYEHQENIQLQKRVETGVQQQSERLDFHLFISSLIYSQPPKDTLL